MRQAARIDANQPDIVKALRKIGASVFVIGRPVDLLVGFRQRSYIFEIKDPDQDYSHRKLNPFQTKFFQEWQGQVDKIETAEAAIKIITEQK